MSKSAAAKKVVPLPLMLVDRGATRAELKRALDRYTEVVAKIDELRRRADARRSEARLFLAELGGSLEDLDESQLRKHNALELDADTADTERTQLEEEVRTLNVAIKNAQDALKAPSSLFVHADIAKHFADVKKATEEVALIRTKYDEQLAKAGAGDGGDSVADADTMAVEDAKAAIALGEQPEGTLKPLEERKAKNDAAAKRARESAASRAADARATAAGLKRRLTKAEEHLTDLQARTPDVCYVALRSEAEAVGEAYVKKGGELMALHKRLIALDQVARRFTEHRDKPVFVMTRTPPRLPAFNMKACESHKAPGSSYSEHLHFPEHSYYKDDEFREACEKELAPLRALGLDR